MTMKAGVAGAGVFGGYHANKYVEAENAELIGIFDLHPERAEERAAQLGCRFFPELDAFLAEIDVLTVAVPATHHYEVALQALQAGVNVLVEKPVAMAMDEADRLINLAAEKGLVLQVGHQERYIFDAFGLLERPMPKEVHSRRLNKFSGRAMDVSVVFDLMIHDLDLLNQVSEGLVADLTASGKFVHGDKSDHTVAEITYENGMKAVLAASRLEEEPVRDMRLVYDDGEIHIDFLKRQVTNTTGQPVKLDFDTQNPPLSFRDPLSFGTQSFLKAVEEKTHPIVDGAAGRAALDLALRIEAAAQ